MNEARWVRIAERGTMGTLRAARWLSRVFGRRGMRVLFWPIALYFFVSVRDARRGSLQYQRFVAASPEGRAALGRPPGALLTLRHIYAFSVNVYDRILLWAGAFDGVAEHDGSEVIFELAESGRGAILLGAHLGSLDMLGFLSRQNDLRVTIVVFHGNARRVNAFLESMAPDVKVRMIDIDPGSVQAAFEIKACIDRGEFVAILADRVAPGKGNRVVRTKFFGRPAAFPLGPFLLPVVLRCPVFLTGCVATGDARYKTFLRPLGEALRVPAAKRDERAQALLERYVELLESLCTRYPLQWFNFYEFWEDGAA